MSKCPYCKIEVGGKPDKCPLCQSRLVGDGEEAIFPVSQALKFKSFLYKLQMLIVISIVISGLGLDFLHHTKIPGYPKLHWSLILAMWLLVFEFLIMRQFRPGTGSARKITIMVLILLVMLLITAYFFRFMWIAWDWVVPIVLTGMITANFVLAMIDRHGNTMAYLLSGLFSGLLPCVIRLIAGNKIPMAWIICMMVGAILFTGAVIFRGRSVASEIRKRFNM